MRASASPLLIAGLAALLGGAAAPPTPALPPPPDPPPVTWTDTPTPAQVAAAFPTAAKAKGLSGAATLVCALSAGRLSDCAVRHQWPEGEGFGAAALTLAPFYAAETPDQVAVVRVEWRQPALEKAEAAARAGDYAAIEPLPPRETVWTRRPTAETVGRYYPPAAAREGLGGSVDLLCLIGLRGAPESCVIQAETPADRGFGPIAAGKIAPRMQAAAIAGDGRPSQGRAVQIKMAFQPADPAPTAAAAPPAAAPAPATPGVPAAAAAKSVKDAPWAGGPTPEQLDKAFPAAAREAGVSGRSSMTCKVKATGELEACRIDSEFPAAAGFGAASLSVAPLFRLKPTTADGRSVAGAAITIPLVWTAPEKPTIRIARPVVDPKAGEWIPATTTRPAEAAPAEPKPAD